jgi:HK97 gp10 family phage protein
MGFTVTGLDAIKARIDAHVARVKAGAQDALEQAVDGTFDDSQHDCPVDKGDLKASGKKEVGDLEGSISYGTDHNFYVELGTSRMRAQPFLFPAFVRNGRKFKAQCKRLAKG